MLSSFHIAICPYLHIIILHRIEEKIENANSLDKLWPFDDPPAALIACSDFWMISWSDIMIELSVGSNEVSSEESMCSRYWC